MKTISFIELCNLIKEGNAPREIDVSGMKFRYNNGNYIRYNSDDLLTGWYSLKRLLTDNDLIISIPTEPLLTDKEKAYLKAVIEPFREEITTIELDTFNSIRIFVKNKEKYLLDMIVYECFEFKGLEIDKEYSLEELGLDRKEE